ncbi:MAG: stage II sporulation protein M [Gammaproteobacteria bacterium]|nr:stage II sporulation protein M [Gammaproteobacteria bacterium]
MTPTAEHDPLRRGLLDRRPRWQAALAELERLERGRASDAAEAARAVEHYRMLAADVAIARRLIPGSRTHEFLENAYARAHAVLHRPALRPWLAIGSALRDELPDAMRWLRPYLLASVALFALACAAGWWLISAHPDLIGLLLPPASIEAVERGELWTDSLLNATPPAMLSADITRNNLVVAVFAYCAGFLFGLGTFYIIGFNGLLIGGLFAFTTRHGLGGRLFEFALPHGPVELACLCIAGAAGAAVGEALVRPGDLNRAAAFASATWRASRPMFAVIVLLIGCGLIEGYVSPNPRVPIAARAAIGVGYFLLMIALLRGSLFGRNRGRSAVSQ